MTKFLKGMQILDLSHLLPGPFCTKLLCDLGATVIKVESPYKKDFARSKPAAFRRINQGKKLLELDFQEKDGKAHLLELVKQSHVLIEGFRPGVMKKMGLDYPTLKKINPKLVYCSVTGYGQSSRRSQEAGHDMNFLGYAKIFNKPPSMIRFQIADVAGGSQTAALRILAAYIHMRKTGQGSFIDVAMAEEVKKLNPLLTDELFSGEFPRYSFYETKDGKFMAFAAVEQKFFENFLKIVHRVDLKETKTRDLKKELAKIFRSKTQKQWTKILSSQETCCTPVTTFT